MAKQQSLARRLDTREKRKRSWNKTRRKNTFGRVANFSHHMIQALLGGEIFPERDVRGDIDHPELGCMIEVKASDNNHAIRIPLYQLQMHLQKLPFPYDRYLYVFFCYRNRNGDGGKNRKTKLHRETSVRGVHDVLSQQADVIYVIDIQIIKRFRNAFWDLRVGNHRIGRNDFDKEALGIRRSDLSFLSDTELRPKLFKELRLKQNSWTVTERPLTLNFNPGSGFRNVNCRLVSVLPKGFHARFYEHLDKQYALGLEGTAANI